VSSLNTPCRNCPSYRFDPSLFIDVRGIRLKNHRAVIEAALFAAGRTLSLRELSDLAGLKDEETLVEVEELAADYTSRSGGMEIRKVGEGYIMQVRASLAQRVMPIAPRELEAPLTRTLAVIAFRQPIRQSELAEIRGNKSYGHVKELEKMGLITSARQGRTRVLTTTKAFAEYFGLSSDRPESIKSAIREDKRPVGVTAMYESLAHRLGLCYLVINPYKPEEEDLERLKQIRMLVAAPGYAQEIREHYSGDLIEASVGTLSQLRESARRICLAAGEGDIEPLAAEIDALLRLYREEARAARSIHPLTAMIEDMAKDLHIPQEPKGVRVAPDYASCKAEVKLPTHQPYQIDILERVKQRYEALLNGLRSTS
jgi:segregation and condensation protein B